jgi:hypothetical protein
MIAWVFERIVLHQGPLTKKHPDYKGDMYNVIVECPNGETTTEPLNIIVVDYPVSCALYTRDNQLLDTPGWRQF